MPRFPWKGAIGFGLVSVPVQIVPAVEEHDVVLHEVHDEDGGRVRAGPFRGLCWTVRCSA